ncbi:hypothetical protein AC249_AIPGENE20969 [Exaiptasia diaphana]|nr:hypothetical protein AC249_AIPGENE20969 [Exaiptasia diaphana]
MKRSRSDSEESVASDTDSDIFEDDDIEDILQDISPEIPRKKALDFLHTLASSKNILYWNSHGEMMYHQRRIPVTNIAELIEYAILPYSLDIKAPRGLNTFIKGLVEVGIDKKLIGNKRTLADLVARQPDEEESDLSDSQTSDSSEIQESDSEEEEEKESEQEKNELPTSPESSDSGSDDEVEECHVCSDFKPFYTIPVVQCPKLDSHTTKAKFMRCQECDAVHKLSLKSKKLKLIDNVDNTDQEKAE